jgi:hypothetical protein
MPRDRQCAASSRFVLQSDEFRVGCDSARLALTIDGEGTLARYVITSANRLPFSPTHHVYKPEEKENKKRQRLADRLLTVMPTGGTRQTGTATGAVAAFPRAQRPCPQLLGRLGEKPEVSALCLFLDPINELAILGSPGDYEQEDAYEALTASVSPLQISDAAKSSKVINEEWGDAEVPVWLLSLTGELISCTAQYVSDLVGARAVPDELSLRGGEIPRSDGFPPDDPSSYAIYSQRHRR